jgi:hypothetical protein
MTFPAGTSVTVNCTAFGANSSNSFCVEFFVKYDTLTANSTLVGLGSFDSPNFNFRANSSVLQVNSMQPGSTFASRGSVNALANGGISSNVAFLANTWYHIAYMGTGSNTYLGINGRVYNLNSAGGDGATADGLWDAGTLSIIGNINATSNSANIYISNFRLVSNGTVYNVQGFVPPNTQLTAISNTRVLLANSTFRNEANSITLTTTGSPSISSGDVVYRFPLMSDVQFTNTVPTLYANGTSNSSVETYIVRDRGSGANQISKVIESLPSMTTGYANGTSNSSTETYIVRDRGSGANQISKVIESLPSMTTGYANATSNSSVETYIVRARGSGANEINLAAKSIIKVFYDKDGRIINQFTWG